MSHKVIDLFCGCGGFSEGMRQAGFDIILGIDSWLPALKSFKHNHKCDVIQADIRDISRLPECDIIIGSPPCQNFSSANTKKKVCDGLELVHEFERIVELNHPKYWVWENVEFVKRFYPQASILNSWDFGLMQRRKRAFVSNIPFFRSGSTRGGWTPNYGYDGSISGKGEEHVCKSGTVRTKRIRDLETNELIDIPRVRELMGFPADYFVSGGVTDQQKQLGNAVCPPIARELAEAIIEDQESLVSGSTVFESTTMT